MKYAANTHAPQVTNADQSTLANESFSGAAQLHGAQQSQSGFANFIHTTTLKGLLALSSFGGFGGAAAVTGGAASFMAASNTAPVANGDLVISLEYEPQHRARGIDRSVLMGGNTAGVELFRDTGSNPGPTLGSAIMFNRHGRGFALSAGHIGVHRDFTFFTGWMRSITEVKSLGQ